MNTKRVTEVGIAWCCGVALGALYVGLLAYPTQEVITTGVEPAWMSETMRLVKIMVGIMGLGVVGLAYQTYQDVNDDE